MDATASCFVVFVVLSYKESKVGSILLFQKNICNIVLQPEQSAKDYQAVEPDAVAAARLKPLAVVGVGAYVAPNRRTLKAATIKPTWVGESTILTSRRRSANLKNYGCDYQADVGWQVYNTKKPTQVGESKKTIKPTT